MITLTVEICERYLGEDHSNGVVGDSSQFDDPEMFVVVVPGVELHIVFTLSVDIFLEDLPPVQRGGPGLFPPQPGLFTHRPLLAGRVRGLTEVVRALRQDARVLVITPAAGAAAAGNKEELRTLFYILIILSQSVSQSGSRAVCSTTMSRRKNIASL